MTMRLRRAQRTGLLTLRSRRGKACLIGHSGPIKSLNKFQNRKRHEAKQLILELKELVKEYGER